MIRSMTGYGEAHYSDGEGASVLEVRSLNNRYFKASIKLPESLTVFEPDIEKLLRTRLTRGSVTYTLRVRGGRAEAGQDINVAALASYLDQLGKLALPGQARIDLAALLALPGVCQPPQLSEPERRRQWTIIEQMSYEALDQVIGMRMDEGRALREDLLAQCRLIRQHAAEVARRAPMVLQDYYQRLSQRVNALIREARLPLESDDLQREVALYAERCDINEETARLAAHLDRFEELCDSDEIAGRKLDFLAQELLREANTIGSKANDSAIAHRVVEIKTAIDRLKEQVQNIE